MANEINKRDQNFVTVLSGVTDDADQDVTMLRVDPITKRLLVKASGSPSFGVSSLNGLTGNVTISAGSNITVHVVGNDIEISSSGGGGGGVWGTITGTLSNQTDLQNALNAKQASITGLNTQVLFFDGDNTPAGDSTFLFDKVFKTLSAKYLYSTDGYVLSSGAHPFVDLYDTDVNDYAGLDMRGTTALRIYAPTGAKIRMMNSVDLQGVYISGQFVPDIDDNYDIGSPTNAWAGLYLGNDETIYFGNNPHIFQGVGLDNNLYLTAPSGYTVAIYDSTTTFSALLSTVSLTADRTVTFPDENGTFILERRSNELVDRILDANDSNTKFYNTGSGGTVVLTLPEAVAGMRFTMFVTEAQVFRFQLPGGTSTLYVDTEQISNTGYIESSEILSIIEIYSIENNIYEVTNLAGNWTM